MATSVRSGGCAARAAPPAQDDVVTCEWVPDLAGDGADRLLEPLVAERLDLAAVVAHDVMVMVAARSCRLVPSRSAA